MRDAHYNGWQGAADARNFFFESAWNLQQHNQLRKESCIWRPTSRIRTIEDLANHNQNHTLVVISAIDGSNRQLLELSSDTKTTIITLSVNSSRREELW
jgi:hypothetical protein